MLPLRRCRTTLEKAASDQRESALRIERNELSFKEKLLFDTLQNASSVSLPFFFVKEDTAGEVIKKLDGIISEVSEFCQIREELLNRISLLDDKIKELSADFNQWRLPFMIMLLCTSN